MTMNAKVRKAVSTLREMGVTIHRAPSKSDAEMCRENGWNVGCVLQGDEGNGVTRIVLTAVGEDKVLARAIMREGNTVRGEREGLWTLFLRTWSRVDPLADGPTSSPAGGEP